MGHNPRVLTSAETSLLVHHDLVVLDLDGVVYIGDDGVPHAAEALSRARAHGSRLAYVTNNAARTPEQV
ncbi:MAG: HAD family hydrolase, partial [Myxococcales bacterium]